MFATVAVRLRPALCETGGGGASSRRQSELDGATHDGCACLSQPGGSAFQSVRPAGSTGQAPPTNSSTNENQRQKERKQTPGCQVHTAAGAPGSESRLEIKLEQVRGASSDAKIWRSPHTQYDSLSHASGHPASAAEPELLYRQLPLPEMIIQPAVLPLVVVESRSPCSPWSIFGHFLVNFHKRSS